MSAQQPSLKKIRSQTPDVIVAVGQGHSMQEFYCYRVILSFASEYFDTMLSASMIENETGRIEFPNKDPLHWREFYSFIDPNKLSVVETHTSIDVATAMKFVPWFHEFQMMSFLNKCDIVLAGSVDKNVADGVDVGYSNGFFREIVELLLLACTYDLDRTIDKAEEFICSTLQMIHDTSDLFDTESIRSLHSTFAPIEKEQYTFPNEFGQEEVAREIIPVGKSKRIFNAFLSMRVSSDKKVFIYDLVDDLGLDTINNAEVFPLLLHSYVQRAASVASLAVTEFNYKRSLIDRDESLVAAKSIINDLLLKTPGTVDQYTELFQTIEGQVYTVKSRAWDCLFQKGVLTPTRVKQQYRENMLRISHAIMATGRITPTRPSFSTYRRSQSGKRRSV